MNVMEKVRELIELMNEKDLAELEVEEADARIRIKKHQEPVYAPPAYSGQQMPQLPQQQLALEGETQEGAEGPPAEQDEGLEEITSPMVGTFYRSSSPGADAYVNKGSEVEPDTVVCIVEAMKVMNEIKAGVEGEIVEILVEDAEPVEFGQPLFQVRPTEAS